MHAVEGTAGTAGEPEDAAAEEDAGDEAWYTTLVRDAERKTKDRVKWNSVVWLLRSGDRHRRSFAELDERRRAIASSGNFLCSSGNKRLRTERISCSARTQTTEVKYEANTCACYKCSLPT